MKHSLLILLALVILPACTSTSESVRVATSTPIFAPTPIATPVVLCLDIAEDYAYSIDDLSARWDKMAANTALDLEETLKGLQAINSEIGALEGPECMTAVGQAFYAGVVASTWIGELYMRNAPDPEINRAKDYAEGLHAIFKSEIAALYSKPASFSTDFPLPTAIPTIPALVTDPNAPCRETAELQLMHQDILFERWGDAFQLGFDAWAATGNDTDPSAVIRELEIVQQSIDYTEQVPCIYQARHAFFMLTQSSITMFTAIKENKTEDQVLDLWKQEARWLEKYTKARQAIGPWSP